MIVNSQMMETWRPRALAALRIVTAYLFIPHGTAKLFGVPHQAVFDGLQLMSLMGLSRGQGVGFRSRTAIASHLIDRRKHMSRTDKQITGSNITRVYTALPRGAQQKSG